MSQYPDSRRPGPARRAGGVDPTLQNPASAPADSQLDPHAPLQSWGKWEQTRHYSLEVVQHPLRCRMAGFGDRDRRPLAPAVVAKMVVRNETSRILDVDDVEIDFFLVTCDLWSSDGHQELNLVQNPSSVSKKKRPNEHPGSGHASAEESAEPVHPAPAFPVPSSGIPSQPTENYSGPGNFGRYPPASGPYPPAQSAWPQSTYSAPPPQWEGPNPPTLPSITTLVPSTSAGPWDQMGSTYSEGSAHQNFGMYSGPLTDAPGQRAGGPSSRNTANSQGWTGGSGRYGDSYNDAEASYVGAGSSNAPSAQSPPSQGAQSAQVEYTRTLVGPLSANAARLRDDKSQPGIFFTFQDLSVRTEGTFRLRLRLMNVGTSFARPTPSSATPQVHNAISPVLALTWTEPFTVYSAKKFPGVPPITDLSKAFAAQGQKLPLRSRGGNRARQRGGSEDDEGSDVGSGGEEV